MRKRIPNFDAAWKTAKSLNFKDVPENVLKIIAQHPIYHIEYCLAVHFKNIPEIIIEGVSKDSLSCEFFVDFGRFNENVPPKIHEAIMKRENNEFKDWYVRHLLEYSRKKKLEKLLK